MTSRERVFASLDGALPSGSEGRVPRHLWTLPWAERHHPDMIERLAAEFPNDIVSPPASYLENPKITGDPYLRGIYVDEWGCTFENLQPGVIGEVKHPRIADLSEVDNLRPPRELLSLDIDAVNRFCGESDRFVLMGSCARPFERLQFLRTTEHLYLDLGALAAGDGDPRFERLLSKVHRFYCDELSAWAETDVDALFFMDDWGSQQSLLINPAQWREVFKPLYREYIDIAHQAGKQIFMHSDGYIADILPDLIDLGLDAVNSQLFCMGLDRLAGFGGDICFWGEIDRQHLLPEASTEEIAAAVAEVKKTLYDHGRIIAQCEFGPGARPENVYEVFAAWDRLTG